MTVPTALQIAATWVGFVVVALALGESVLRGTDRLVARWATPSAREPSLVRFALALLIGFGTAAYVAVVLGLAHAFHPATLAAAGVVAAIAGRDGLEMHLRWLVRARPEGGAAAPFLLIAAAAYVVWALAALSPPSAPDALAYHLPEAQALVRDHDLPAVLGGHWFYGNLPVLGEVLWASGIAFAGLAMSQVLHVTIFGAFVLLAFGLVRELFGPLTAALAAAAITTYVDLGQNASQPMVDAATVSFEIGALLCVVAFVQRHRAEDLPAAALLIGFALATKYAAAPTALFLAVVVGVVLARRVPRPVLWKFSGALAGLAVVAGGYWYAKNLVRLGNPVYPFLFGHDGITEDTYAVTTRSIQGFGETNTLGEFVRTPERFLDVTVAPVFLPFFLAPFALLTRRSRTAVALLLTFYVLYLPYWFWFATHSVRFLMGAMVVGVILVAVVAGTVAERLSQRSARVAVAAGLALLLAAVLRVGPSTVATSIGLPEGFPAYQVGALSRDEVLERELGCDYAATRALRAFPPGPVRNDWTAGAGVTLNAYTDADHPLVRADEPARYAFVNLSYGNAPAPRGARVTWQRGTCRLYELRPGDARRARTTPSTG